MSKVLRIAVPAIVANITTPLLSLVDIAIVGHINVATASAIGAIAIGGSVFNMLYWLCNFLRIGSSGMTAQAVGARNFSARDRVLHRSLSIGLTIGIAIIVLSPAISAIVIPFMEGDAPTSAMAEEYFLITVWGAPAVLITYATTGWLIGNQNSKATLITSLTSNIINIIVSAGLVIGFGLGIAGVAVGTLTAQWAGAAVGIWQCRKVDPHPLFTKAAMAASLSGGRGAWKPFFAVNRDIFLRTACIVAVTVWFTREGARLGSDILAANALIMQLFTLYSFFMDGFAFAGEALAGKALGAGSMRVVRRVTAALLKWGVCLGVAGAIFYFLCGEWIFGILTDDLHIAATAKDYLPWAVTIPLAGFMAFIYDGICVGMTRTRYMLLSMACAMALFFLTYLLLRGVWGNHALWLAFCVYLLTRGIGLHFLLRKE